MKLMRSLIATAAIACAASSAHALIYTYTGNTTAGPTFNRPLEDLSALSAVGVSVRYSAFNFTVSISGDYTFLTTGEFDTFSILYSPAFNAGAPLTNAIVANDDLLSPPFTTSGFVATLTAGTPYVNITTGFDPTEFGAFSTTIGGPGVVTVVPEPASYAMLGLGIAALAMRRRRERAAND